MPIVPGSVEHMAQIISHVVGPAFLLGAVAGLISILSARLGAILERIRALGLADGAPESAAHPDAAKLRRCAELLHCASLFVICAGITTLSQIIVSFIAAFLGFQHVWMAALLFIVSGLLLVVGLGLFGLELAMRGTWPRL